MTSGAAPPDDASGDATRWLNPGVAGIGTASLLSDLGHEIPTALLPALVTSTLGGSAAALGLIEGVSDALSGIAKVAGGPPADDPGRRRTIAVGGYTVTAVLSSAVAVATSVGQVAALRAGAWAARGIRGPSRNALLADVVPSQAYGRAYGFERAMDNLGAVLGPLAALLLVSLLGVRWAIGLSIIPGLLAALAIVLAVRYAPRLARRDRGRFRIRLRPLLRGRLGTLLVGVTAFEVGNVAATLLILRAQEQLVPQYGSQRAVQIAILLYAAYNLSATLASIPGGHLVDRTSRGPVRVLLIGVALFASAYAWFAGPAASAALLLPAFVLAGVAIGFVETAESSAVAALAPTDLRGSAFGLLAGIQSMGNLVASAVAGFLWSQFSPTVAFLYLAAWMVVAFGAFLWVRVRDNAARP